MIDHPYRPCQNPEHATQHCGQVNVLTSLECSGLERDHLAQPPPVPNSSRPVWELVIEDMRGRDRHGREKYGTPLQAHNGRDALKDAYEESLDQTVYLRQALVERDEAPWILKLVDYLEHRYDCESRSMFGKCTCGLENVMMRRWSLVGELETTTERELQQLLKLADACEPPPGVAVSGTMTTMTVFTSRIRSLVAEIRAWRAKS